MRHGGQAMGNGTRTAAAALLFFLLHPLLLGAGCAESGGHAPEVFVAEEILARDRFLSTDFDGQDGADVVAPCLQETFDADLVQWLESRIEDYPGIDSESYVVPDSEELRQFRDTLALLMVADHCAAAAAAAGAGYELVTMFDTGNNGGVLYLLQPESGAERGRGLYVVRPDAARELVIEAPHPIYDLRSALAAAAIFRFTGARALAVAGTHRCANAAPAGCDGTTSVCNGGEWGSYRESDMAHVDGSFFQVFHEVLSTEQPSTVAVQLHGMASNDDDPEFSVSDGTEADNPDSQHPPNLLAADLAQRIAAAGSKKPGNSCNRESDKNVNCGKTNTQGRFSNGVPADAVCTTAPGAGTGAFIHLELSKELRHPGGSLGPHLIIDTVLELVPESR